MCIFVFVDQITNLITIGLCFVNVNQGQPQLQKEVVMHLDERHATSLHCANTLV